MNDLPFQGDVTFLDPFHVEAHCGNRAYVGDASQIRRSGTINVDLLYGKLSTLAMIASAFRRIHSPRALPQGHAEEMSCQHFADQSWLHPSQSPY